MNEPRCPECGSWERECIAYAPVADCGCQRCLRARLVAAKALLQRAYDEDGLRQSTAFDIQKFLHPLGVKP